MADLLGICLNALLVGLAYAAGREIGRCEGFARGFTIGTHLAASRLKGETGAALTHREPKP